MNKKNHPIHPDCAIFQIGGISFDCIIIISTYHTRQKLQKVCEIPSNLLKYDNISIVENLIF